MTLPEMLIALTVLSIAAAFGAGGLAEYREATSAARAARAIRADVAMARSLAIRARAPVSLVARESLRAYIIRDTAGTVLHERVFDNTSEIALTALDVATAGDSLTFDSRGILLTTGALRIDATRGRRTRSVTFNLLGRAQIN